MTPTGPGRPAKTIPYQLVADLQADMNFNMAFHGGMPATPAFREFIIVALLQRLSHEHPALFEHCAKAIATIANLECCLTVSAERIVQEVGKELISIAESKVRRWTHYPETLRQQRAALLDYLRVKQYPATATNPAHRKLWLKDHWPTLMRLLQPLQCFCPQYNTDYSELAETMKLSRRPFDRCQTSADIADLILAHLHKISFIQARKLIKTSV